MPHPFPAMAEPGARLAEIVARVRTPLAPETGLSTDFLNQYNEVAMILDLAPDDPDLLDELAHWQPRTYGAHFEHSGFRDWELLVEAFELSPAAVRARFDPLVGLLDALTVAGLRAINDSRGVAPDDTFRAMAAMLADMIRSQAVLLGGIINGTHSVAAQNQVDTLFDALTGNEDASELDIDALFAAESRQASTQTSSQANIDSLFDDGPASQADIDALFD